MIQTKINAVIFYQHSAEEVAGLNAAMIPMADHIRAVSNGFDRGTIKKILNGEYFRLKEAERMHLILLRATRHARANLVDYFPYMREQIMENAERLEVATDLYWQELRHMVDEVIPSR